MNTSRKAPKLGIVLSDTIETIDESSYQKLIKTIRVATVAALFTAPKMGEAKDSAAQYKKQALHFIDHTNIAAADRMFWLYRACSIIEECAGERTPDVAAALKDIEDILIGYKRKDGKLVLSDAFVNNHEKLGAELVKEYIEWVSDLDSP